MFQLSAPLIVGIIITNKCNLRCVHCINSAHINDEELDYDTIKNIIDQCSEIGVKYIDINGGEIFLFDKLDELIFYAHSLGLKIIITTNGTLLSESWLKKFQDKIFLMRISLDSHLETIHDKFRGQRGCFAKTVHNIEIANKYNYNITILSTISKSNYLFISELVQFVKSLSVNALHTIFLMPTGRGTNLSDAIMNSEDTYLFLTECEIIRKNLNETNDKFVLLEETPQSILIKENVDIDRYSKCGAAYVQLVITHKGFAIPCGGFLGAGNDFMAEELDIRKHSLKEIYTNSKLFSDIRNIYNIEGKCKQCEFLKNCGGGCRVAGWLDSKCTNIFAADPFCWQ